MATDNSGASATSNAVLVTITAAPQTPQAYYIHTDQLNTPRLITDSNNQAVWRWDNWEPFGNYITDEDPNNTGNKFTFNLRFPGQYYDSETQTHYNYFRDYDPQTGSYRQSDPIGLEGGQFSTYAYVGGSPLSYTDPKGEFLVAAIPYVVGGVATGSALWWAANHPAGTRDSSSGSDPFGMGGETSSSSSSILDRLTDNAGAVAATEGVCGSKDKWMCEGPGSFDSGQGAKDVTRSGWYVAYGRSESDARYNWRKLVQSSAPSGSNARHIRPKRCKKIR